MWLSIVKLIIASLVPVAAASAVYVLEKHGKLNKLSYAARQIIIGIVFGAIAIMGTEWGIPMNGVMINCRDAAPLVAGLVFGAPSGIIAGVLGGVERYVAVAWGVGSFTRVACSVSTALCGFIAALVRKFLLENKKPNWGMALGIGVVMEVFHLNMVFITNIKDATKAIMVIDTCFVPMVIAVGLSVMFSAMAVSMLAGEFVLRKSSSEQSTPIFETIQRWLLIVLSVVFVIMTFFNYVVQANMANNEAKNMIFTTLDEVSQDVSDASDAYMLSITRVIGREVASGYYSMDRLANKYDFTDISVVDKNGIIIDSNNPSYIGFDMTSGEQSAEFMCLLDGQEEYAQAYGPISKDANVSRKYAGVAIPNGFVQTGYDADTFQKQVDRQIRTMADNRHVGNDGGVIIFDESGKLLSISKNIERRYYDDEKVAQVIAMPKNKIFNIEIGESLYYIATKDIEGYVVVAIYSDAEAKLTKAVSLYVTFFSMILTFAIMFVLIYMLIKRIVVNQIMKMTQSLSSISAGNLDEVVNVRSNKEFASLSDDINSTVDTLKRYIAEAAARIDKELEFAKNIQESALPNVFPVRDDYEIYASMFTAKEVGGDFYDFYMTDDNTLNFLVADVSGKGIPAAMFMMRAKSVLKSCTERGLDVNDAFTSGNDTLCTGNDAGMFVTAWQGTLKLDDGTVYFANAGHNLPALKRKGGKFEYVKQKVNFVLAGMEGIPYTLNEIKMEPGDVIYLYTDGVTEATNAQNELFGDDRLLEALNSDDYDNPKQICDVVKSHVDSFVNEADQFDDITMVCLKYKGPSKGSINI